jgi:hypothetical protein
MKNSNFTTKKSSSNYKKSIFNKTAGFFSLLLIVISLIFLNSCKKDNKPDPEPVNNGGFEILEETEVNMDEIMEQLMVYPDDPDVFDYHDVFNEIKKTAEEDSLLTFNLVLSSKVMYKSIDNKGEEIELSGFFIYPIAFEKVKTPIISYNHGLQLEKKYAPSQYSLWKGEPLKFAEVLIAEAMAAYFGWAVIMPDYQGMGEDITENHPMCVREKLAIATADMIKAAKETIMPDYHEFVEWDGNTFLLGYSEGGFVTMAATQELEKRNEPINGVACMDGPYDLTGTMLDVMLSNDPFPIPFFLPMFAVGLNTIYPESFVYDVMLKVPYNDTIPKYTNGFYSESFVNGIMPSSHILKEVLTDNFIDTLENVNSNAYKILYKNNTFINNESEVWIPTTKMLLWHCKNDDCVPFGNFTKVKSEFGTIPNIEYVEWPPIDPVFGQTIHVSAAPIAFWEGSRWIYDQTK